MSRVGHNDRRERRYRRSAGGLLAALSCPAEAAARAKCSAEARRLSATRRHKLAKLARPLLLMACLAMTGPALGATSSSSTSAELTSSSTATPEQTTSSTAEPEHTTSSTAISSSTATPEPTSSSSTAEPEHTTSSTAHVTTTPAPNINCSVNTFMWVDAEGEQDCYSCPEFSTSPASSVGNVSCLCNIGYAGPMGGACVACAAGKYKNTTGNASCTDCPAYSNSSMAATNVSQCQCIVGASGPDGGECRACDAGKYKDDLGSENCTECPQSSTSLIGSASVAECRCLPGTTGLNGQMCTACLMGKYKDSLGSSPCLRCSGATYSNRSGTTACMQCPVDTRQDVNATGCVSCGPGTRVGPGGSSCLGDFVSVRGTMTVSINQTTFETYRSKYVEGIAHLAGVSPSFVEILSVEAASRRLLRRLFSSHNPSVTFTFQIAVTSSSVSTVIGNLTESAMNQWATQNGLPHVVLASIAATCGMGREPSVSAQDCMSCKPGYFKFLLDNTTCQACAANTYLNSTGGTNCLPCPSNTSAASGSAACGCAPGFTGPDGGPCTFCRVGSFKSVNGSAACSSCPGNSSSPAGSIQALACECNAGFAGGAGGPCSACPAGTYTPAAGFQTCQNCAGNLTSLPGRSICGCVAGYTGPDGGPCTPCPAGMYKAVAGPSICLDCPSHSNSVPGSSACGCNVGYTESVGGTCEACPEGKYKNITGSSACTNCSSGAASEAGSSICKCSEGFTGPDGGTCTACAEGKFKSTNGDQACALCTVGKYKANPGSGECVSCPAGASSEPGSVDVSACEFRCETFEYSSLEEASVTTVTDYAFDVSSRFQPDGLGDAFLGPCSQNQTLICSDSSDSSGPACEVVFPSLPNQSDVSLWAVTIKIVSSDFGSPTEYVSAVKFGEQTIGTGFLKDDGVDDCDVISTIVSTQALNASNLNAAGELKVRIETTSQVGLTCSSYSNAYLYATVSLVYTGPPNCLGNVESVIACSAVFPSQGQMADGMLWHFGGNTSSSFGAWMGIRYSDSGAPVLKIRAGDGGPLDTMGSNQMLVNISNFPQDGFEHHVVVQIGRPSSGQWALQVCSLA